jgi:hypothetical protein
LLASYFSFAGTRHEGRPVAIDSCVARRPPALKASAEDAAVERLAQLLLSAPEVSRSLLQQLLANIKRNSGVCSRLTLDGAAEASDASDTEAAVAAGVAKDSRTGSVGGTVGTAAGDGPLAFSDADIAGFQAGLRKCLTGVLQIKVSFCCSWLAQRGALQYYCATAFLLWNDSSDQRLDIAGLQ